MPGESSWLAAPLLHHLPAGTPVLHQVRDPLRIIGQEHKPDLEFARGPLLNQFKCAPQSAGASPPLPDPNMVNEPMMDVGQVALPQEMAAQKFESKASAGSNIGRGMKDIIAGVVLIGIGLVFGGSIFLGTADTLDIFFDCLGLFWIGLGIYKMIR